MLNFPKIYNSSKCFSLSVNKEKLFAAVKKSDVLITDGCHRMIGLYFRGKEMDRPILPLIAMRHELPYVNQVATIFGKKIIYDRELSARLFSNHVPGESLSTEFFTEVARIYIKMNIW